LKNDFVKRMLYHFLGLLLMTFGIALSSKGGVGVASVSTIAFAGSRLTPLTFGTCSSLFHGFCFISQIVITRRFTARSLLQIPMVYLFGFFLDIFNNLLTFAAANVIVGCLLVAAATPVISLGLRVILGADFAMAPPDALARTIGDKAGWPMAKAKFIFDVAVVSASAALTWVFLGSPFVAVGFGTVITMLMTGPMIGFFVKLFPFFDVAKKAGADEAAADDDASDDAASNEAVIDEAAADEADAD